MFPFFGHQDGVLLLCGLIDCISHLLAVQEELLGVFRMEGREHGEEVFPGAAATFWIFVWEVIGHFFKEHALVVEVGHRDLVVSRRVAMSGFFYFQQLLVATHDLL